MITEKELKIYLYKYIGKKIIFPLITFLLTPIGIWLMFFDENRSNSAHRIIQRIETIIGLPCISLFWIERFKSIFKIILDIFTKCQIQTMHVTVITDSTMWNDMDHFKGERNRYHMYTVRQENGKRFRLIKDEKVCNTRLVEGNVHTICILKHSKFLLDAQVGKNKAVHAFLPHNSTTE